MFRCASTSSCAHSMRERISCAVSHSDICRLHRTSWCYCCAYLFAAVAVVLVSFAANFQRLCERWQREREREREALRNVLATHLISVAHNRNEQVCDHQDRNYVLLSHHLHTKTQRQMPMEKIHFDIHRFLPFSRSVRLGQVGNCWVAAFDWSRRVCLCVRKRARASEERRTNRFE